MCHRAALGQKRDAFVQGAEQAFEVCTISGQYIKGHQHAGGRARRDDAILMLTMEFVVILGLVAAGCLSHLRIGCTAGGHGRATESAACQRGTGDAHAEQYATTLQVDLVLGVV